MMMMMTMMTEVKILMKMMIGSRWLKVILTGFVGNITYNNKNDLQRE